VSEQEARAAREKARKQAYYADSHAAREHSGKEWTREEDEIVLDPGSLTDHEVAELLGRSTRAVDHRRHTLKEMGQCSTS